jgi:transcriptional regulator with XRE-family HTH domain
MVILSNISDRIREFMILKNLTPKTLAEELHVTHATMLNALQCRHAPSTKLFYGLLNLFQCSADYLLGLVDDYPETAHYLPPVENFGEQFSKLLEVTGVSQYALTKQHGISGNLIFRWLHNQTLPSIDNFVKLSKAFSCSVDFILGRSDF